MERLWLLLGALALAGAEIIYPDNEQYMMMINQGRPLPSVPGDYQTALQAASNNQPAQIDQQFNRKNITQFSAARPVEGHFYSATTHAPLHSSEIPIINPELTSNNWSDHVNNIISKGITKFALDLDRAIYSTSSTSAINRHRNIIFSPLSVSLVLSIVLLGSAGKTFDEVARILGLESGVDISQHSEIVHQMFGQLLATMNYRVEGSNMPLTNSACGIFVQEGYPILPQFREISENVYKSEVVNLDFRTRGREAADTINAWVKERTMNKIDGILDGDPHPLTTVILLSALYFKGEWNQHFLQNATQRKEFIIEPNNTVEVDIMYNGGNFPFYEDKSLGVKIVALPYKGLETSMYVLLPKDEGAAALKSFQDKLTAETIENLINNMKNEICIIGFPRMNLSSNFHLNNALHNLGLHSLFNPRTADLSLLSNGFGQTPQAPIPQAPFPLIPQASYPSIPQASYPSIPQAQATPISQESYPSIPQVSSVPIPQPQATPISQAYPAPIPQGYAAPIPQGYAAPFTQAQAAPISQAQAAPIPQGHAAKLMSRPFATSIPQPFATSGPQESSQVSRKIPSMQLPGANPEELLIFSRFGNNQDARRNYFTYDDKKRGVSVEQWATGFNISKNDRMHRAAKSRTRRDSTKSSRETYVMENENPEVPPKADNANTRSMGLEENKYRFRNAERNTKSRRRRQSRPIDQNFLRFMQTQNLRSYGLDTLRNSGNLVNPGLFANDVLHTVKMDVTEKGTEAAAVTGVVLRRDGSQKRLIANRPFMFFIRHDPTKLILFWGTVNKPTPSYH